MTVHALAPEVQARIDADFAAKTGPFALAVLTAHHISSHYDVHCVPAAQLLDRLAARKVYAAVTLWIMDPALKSKKPAEAMVLYLARTPAVLHDAATLEVLNRPLSRFQLGGGNAETEALVLAGLDELTKVGAFLECGDFIVGRPIDDRRVGHFEEL